MCQNKTGKSKKEMTGNGITNLIATDNKTQTMTYYINQIKFLQVIDIIDKGQDLSCPC